MRLNHICLGCMEEKGQAQVCPHCGYREGAPAAAPHYLPPGTVLAGKYLVGRGLGHGGFGTTYIARDLVLNIKLAIKEYLPQDCASRTAGAVQVIPFTGEGEKRFADGLESFLQEARILARFDGHPNIVGVRDFFTENGTAYLVMNYLEGITLKQFLVNSGGQPIPYDKLLGIMLPVMDALKQVHAAGLLHRDVSPDNIFLTTAGHVVLIDFGAARQSMGVQRSLSVILKPGYAPEEQYRSRGRQGPWTDVYALGATMYRALTGRIPPEALERARKETLVPPSQWGVSMPPHAEAALLRAMAVRAEDRFQTVAEFKQALRARGPEGGRPASGKTGHARPAPSRDGRPSKSAPPTAKGQRTPPRGRNTKDPVTYPLKNKRKKGSRAGVLVALILIIVLVLLVAGVFYILQGALDRVAIPLPSGNQTSRPQATPDEPQATPTPAQAEPTPMPEPSQEPTPTPSGPPEFWEGATPSDALSSFAPAPNRRLHILSDGQDEIWLTGTTSGFNALVARFQYDEMGRQPLGDVYFYTMDDQGNLCYGTKDFGAQILLPAGCAVGMEFNGVAGASKVIAVNYSAQTGGRGVQNAVVVQSEQGVLFIEPGRGLVLMQSSLEGGNVYLVMQDDQAVDGSEFHTFVD